MGGRTATAPQVRACAVLPRPPQIASGGSWIFCPTARASRAVGVLAAPSRRPTAAPLVFLALGVSTRWQGVSGKVAGCCVSRLGWPAPSCERLAHGSSAVIFEALANVRRCPPAFTKSWPALHNLFLTMPGGCNWILDQQGHTRSNIYVPSVLVLLELRAYLWCNF